MKGKEFGKFNVNSYHMEEIKKIFPGRSLSLRMLNLISTYSNDTKIIFPNLFETQNATVQKGVHWQESQNPQESSPSARTAFQS